MPYNRQHYTNRYSLATVIYQNGFSQYTFSTNYALFLPQSAVLTSDPSYNEPFKVVIEIWDRKKTTKIAEYSMFDPDISTINVLDCQVNPSAVQGTFSITLDNDDNVIDESEIGLNSFCKFYGGKTVDDLHFLMAGRVINSEPEIIGDQIKNYTISGYSEKAETNNFILNFKRSSSSVPDVNDPDIIKLPDSKMTIENLVKEVTTKKDARLPKDFTVKDHLGLDISGIDPLVNEKILSVNEELKEGGEVYNFLASIVNAFWDIKDGKLIFEYPMLKHSGIIVKNKQESTDHANQVSYFVGPWKYTDSISKEDGHATGLYNVSAADSKSVDSANVVGGASVLFQRTIAQKFSAIDTRFSSFALIMSKIGTPFDQSVAIEDQIVRGRIVLDSGNNSPSTTKIATFDIPISSIPDSQDTVFVANIKVDRTITSPNTSYWLILDACGTDLSNTVRWHHDGIMNHNSATNPRPSAFAAVVDNNIQENNLVWIVDNEGPIYTYNIFSRVRRIQYFSDPDAIDQYGLKEDIVEIPEIEDPISIAKIMQSILALRSSPIRKYVMNEVTLPNGKIFEPGQSITIVDDTANHTEAENIFAIIQDVSYHWSSGDETSLGMFSFSLLPMGFLDFKKKELI